MEDLGNGIFYAEDFFPLHKEFVHEAEKQSHTLTFYGNDNNERIDYNYKVIDHNAVGLSGWAIVNKETPALYDLHKKLMSAIQEKIESFFGKKYESQWQMAKADYSGILVLYQNGSGCMDHVDTVFEDPNEAYNYTSVYYINDSYEGGEIVFPEINLSFKPKENSLIFLPSYMVHRVDNLTSGEKLTCPTFFREIKNAN